ncbi:MAG: MFS transporter [Verrucomicrobiales bacterium]|nr:MFS transporter [Verrucomicrobiaceae bacterium]
MPSPCLMRRLQTQFFVSYAIFGCIGPLLPVYLMEVKGFTETELGYNQALTSIATVLSPILITLLADMKIDPRRILGASFLISALAFYLISISAGVIPSLIFYTLHSLAFMPTVALQDGYYFSLAKRSDDVRATRYHRIRVWGTIGFIVPSVVLYFLLEPDPNLISKVVLYFLLDRDPPLTMVLWCAIAFGVLSALHAQLLPKLPTNLDGEGAGFEVKRRLPSAEAFAALLSPKGRYFLICMGLAYAASTAYHTFFPVYLRSMVGVEASVIGLIINVGVFLEIFYILALGRLRKRFGMRAIMIAGLSAMVVRLALLATFPSVFTAVATQLLHGLEICAVFVLPVMYLNQLASDRFRNSIQGVYTMVVIGGSRIVSGVIGGRIAEVDLRLLFACGAGLAAIAVILLALFFRPEDDYGDAQAERTV